jgi:hypothetical protein
MLMIVKVTQRFSVKCVGFVVVTAVTVKSYITWDITLCSVVKVNRHFGETYRLHLHVEV